MILNKNQPPSKIDLEEFISNINFQMPLGYLDFMKDSNGASIEFEMRYLELWTLNELFPLNEGYEVEKFASDFFLIGSDGGGTAYGIEKSNGKIYELPFIGMNNDSAVFISDDFNGFLNVLDEN